MNEIGLRARIVVFNESCPVCGRTLPLGVNALRVSRELLGRTGTQYLVSFRCHHACSARAIDGHPLELEGALRQQVHEHQRRHVDEIDDAPAPDMLTLFLSPARVGHQPHQEYS